MQLKPEKAVVSVVLAVKSKITEMVFCHLNKAMRPGDVNLLKEEMKGQAAGRRYLGAQQ